MLTDKTNKICIMEKALADEKLNDHIKNSSFRELKKYPSKEYEREGNNLLSEIYCDAGVDIEAREFSILKSRHAEASKIYTMAKDHKPDFPDTKIRPVQPVKHSAIEKMDTLVSKILVQILPLLTHRIGNSKKFQEKIKDPILDTSYIQASLDIENMYPTMPTDNSAINIIKSFLIKHQSSIDTYSFKISHIISMLKFIVTHTYTEIE